MGNKFWIIVHDPECVPDLKGPFQIATMANQVREFIKARPTSLLTILTIDETGPLVQHAPEALQMLDGRSMSVGRKHNERVREAFATITHLSKEVERISLLYRKANQLADAHRRRAEAAEARADEAQARVERLRLYCSAAARDMAGFAAVVKESEDVFPKTLRDLLETSEFMSLAAEGKEDGTLYEDELSKVRARVKVLEEMLKDAVYLAKNSNLKRGIEHLEKQLSALSLHTQEG